MGVSLPNRDSCQSLTLQIKAAERAVLRQQRRVGLGTDRLICRIHQQLTAPSSLLLAGGIGFLIGELTRGQASGAIKTADLPAKRANLWRNALNFIGSVHTLYTALPIAWLVKSYRLTRPPDRAFPACSSPTDTSLQSGQRG